jgi:hypothetical protein
MEELLGVAHHPTSSRVLDALLESPTVPLKAKRQFVLSFIGNFHFLVDDRIGSRVGDRCWAFADTYLKVCSFFSFCRFQRLFDLLFDRHPRKR